MKSAKYVSVDLLGCRFFYCAPGFLPRTMCLSIGRTTLYVTLSNAYGLTATVNADRTLGSRRLLKLCAVKF